MAITVKTVPTEMHPFVPPGSVVIAVKCPDMPVPFLFGFPPPQALEAIAAALASLGAEPPKPMDLMGMTRHSVIVASQQGAFALCKCDERFWMKYGDTHDLCVCSDAPHSHCQVAGHAISKH